MSYPFSQATENKVQSPNKTFLVLFGFFFLFSELTLESSIHPAWCAGKVLDLNSSMSLLLTCWYP